MVNFETKNEGQWFVFNEDNPDQGGICLRILSSDEYEKIEKLTTSKKRKFSHGVAYDDVKVDENLASRMRWDYCIVDWKNVSIDNELVECNKANKMRLVKSLAAMKFISDALEILNEETDVTKEALLKNSGSSQNGNEESPDAKPA